MRCLALAAVSLLVCQVAAAQHFHHGATTAPGRVSPCTKKLAPAVLQPELQKVDWTVTGKLEAQPFFKQGMTQYYGFNFEEAMRNFRRAKEIDDKMAMASWGIALAAGPNLNITMDDPCHKLAIDEIKCADFLTGGGGEAPINCAKQGGISTPLEKKLIQALKKRYVYPATESFKTATENYSKAMGHIWENPEHKNDPNVGALYAESLMDLHPWDLYKNRLPKWEDTETIEKVLKTAMNADEKAVGANHYWIHTAEAGPRPEDAEDSANLLRTRVPASGHLVHMPSHIDLLLGHYEQAVAGNEKAASVDVTQYGEACRGTYEQYTSNSKCPQLYYGHYLSHNYFFGSVSATFSGQSEKAVKLACDTRAHVERFVANEPGLQRYMTVPLMTLVVNRNWNAILAEPQPPEECYAAPFPGTGCHILRAIWHWAKGMRSATLGDGDNAVSQRGEMRKQMDAIPVDGPVTWGNNDAVNVLLIANRILEARINWAESELYGTNPTFRALRSAVDRENNLAYDEPPQWFTPAREALGGAYLQDKKYNEAFWAFEEELERHPLSGRALYGKMRALQGQGRPQAEIDKVKDQFCTAWQYADYTMTDADLWPAMGNEPKNDVTCPAREQKVSKPSESKCLSP